VTLFDVVPLRIEAAANRPLKRVEWFTAINEADDVLHELPPPDDPSYAVYLLELSVPDFAIQNWDIVRYYARATTEEGTVYQSDVYFLEVMPFQEDLEELPLDEQGQEVTAVEQISSMIQRQNEVIRRTHHQTRVSGQSEESREKRLNHLANEEASLRRDASHLAANIASRRARTSTDGPEAHLNRAASLLGHAEDSLLDDRLEEATREERSALGELVAARKDLLEMLREDPSAFKRSEGQADTDTRSLDEQMQDMQSHREQIQTAREFVQKTLLSERNLEKQADPHRRDNFPNLARQQRDLSQSFERHIDETPFSFSESQSECSNAQSEMNRTARAMAEKDPHARQQAGRAAEALQALDDSLEKQQQRDRLEDAYRLREMLERQISQLSQCQKTGVSPGQGERLAQQAQFTSRQLKQIADGEQTRDLFGEKLREALDDQNMERISGQCQQLGQSGSPNGQKAAAGELARQLQQIADAFDASCPGGTRQGTSGKTLAPQGHEAMTRGLQQLENAARGKAGGRSLTAQECAQLAREASANLRAGIASLYGNTDRSSQVIDQLESKVDETESLIDANTVRELIRQIQQLSREREPGAKPDSQRSETSNVDLSRLPPTYRQAIEKYYQKLSEQ
jgi:hypothetical protein